MLIPTRRLLIAVACLAALGIIVSVLPRFVPLEAWLTLAGTLALVALADGLSLLRMPSPPAERILPGSLALGIAREITLRLANPSAHRIELEVYDHHPAGFAIEGMPRHVRIHAMQTVELRYHVRPIARGDQRFAPIELRLASRLRLWQARRRAGGESLVRVYPNFAALAKYALFATDHRLSQLGILQRRRRGEGLDFHQLREHRQGDSLRSIDWKATARTTRLIAREYREERNQQVVFLIDCGRRMLAQDGPLSHFDHTLNAALLLAYVSLRQGDAVGLLTMGTAGLGTTRFFAPRKSAATVNVVLNMVYDLQPTLAASDYQTAALELMQRVRKRALVVIISNLRDEDGEDLAPALRLLQSRHLVIFASLRERVLGATLAKPVETFDDALIHAATADYLANRERTFSRLEKSGAICLDVEPEQLAVSLVNRYLDVKRSGRL